MKNAKTNISCMIDEADYALWQERSIMADCFLSLGLKDIAAKMMNISPNMAIIADYVAIIKHQAIAQQNIDVLDTLAAHHLMNLG